MPTYSFDIIFEADILQPGTSSFLTGDSFVWQGPSGTLTVQDDDDGFSHDENAVGETPTDPTQQSATARNLGVEMEPAYYEAVMGLQDPQGNRYLIAELEVSGRDISPGNGDDVFVFVGRRPEQGTTLTAVERSQDALDLPSAFTSALGVSVQSDGDLPYNLMSAVVFGDAGANTVTGDLFADYMELRRGADVAFGMGGADLMIGGRGRDQLFGGIGNDTALGEIGDDLLVGNQGRDVLRGGQGADSLFGGRGADTVFGGAGPDVLDGGRGFDTLTGGNGQDIFVFALGAGMDVVTDFTDDRDTLRLSSNLWDGTLSVEDVLAQFARETGGDVVFDFGADSVILRGVDRAALIDDIAIL